MYVYLIKVSDDNGVRQFIRTTNRQYADWYINSCTKWYGFTCELYYKSDNSFERVY